MYELRVTVLENVYILLRKVRNFPIFYIRYKKTGQKFLPNIKHFHFSNFLKRNTMHNVPTHYIIHHNLPNKKIRVITTMYIKILHDF